LADMVEAIGGESVDVTTLIGRNADAHAFEPSPQTVQALASAQLLVINGLGFEAWLPRALSSSGFDGMRVVASDGVEARRIADGGSSDGIDPHAWHDLANGMLYAQNI